MKYLRLSAFILMMAFFMGSFAQAQSPSTNKKRTSINFEDQLIRGEVNKPELVYIMQKRQFNFSKLIKLRDNFLPEMRKTADEIPRGGK